MEKIETKEVLTSTTLENELAKGHNYGSGYRSKSWFIVIGEKAMTDLNLNYENIADIDDEAKLLIEEAERHYKKTHNVACLAICLNFSLALRVGELVALRTNDFTDSSVKIDRQEVKTYYVDENNICRRNGYEISSHTKTKMGKRELYLSADAKRYLAMILEHNQNSGFKSEYLLLDENGERIHEFAINNVLRELNRKIGTAQKSNHKIRKTCISFLISSGQLTNEEIRVFAGHEDFATTEKCYEFPTNSMDKRADAYEKALSYTKKV